MLDVGSPCVVFQAGRGWVREAGQVVGGTPGGQLLVLVAEVMRSGVVQRLVTVWHPEVDYNWLPPQPWDSHGPGVVAMSLEEFEQFKRRQEIEDEHLEAAGRPRQTPAELCSALVERGIPVERAQLLSEPPPEGWLGSPPGPSPPTMQTLRRRMLRREHWLPDEGRVEPEAEVSKDEEPPLAREQLATSPASDPNPDDGQPF